MARIHRCLLRCVRRRNFYNIGHRSSFLISSFSSILTLLLSSLALFLSSISRSSSFLILSFFLFLRSHPFSPFHSIDEKEFFSAEEATTVAKNPERMRRKRKRGNRFFGGAPKPRPKPKPIPEPKFGFDDATKNFEKKSFSVETLFFSPRERNERKRG